MASNFSWQKLNLFEEILNQIFKHFIYCFYITQTKKCLHRKGLMGKTYRHKLKKRFRIFLSEGEDSWNNFFWISFICAFASVCADTAAILQYIYVVHMHLVNVIFAYRHNVYLPFRLPSHKLKTNLTTCIYVLQILANKIQSFKKKNSIQNPHSVYHEKSPRWQHKVS